jgi:protein-S-isoprenylcysteine O-methyltransferase Ste14
MTALFCGLLGFVFYFLYDINSITIRSGLLHSTFAIGTVLIAAATGMDLWSAFKMHTFSGIPDLLFLILAALSFAALIYCLFFALPFQETYTEQASNRSVCDKGVYALCRHPGILCFFGTFLFLGLAARPADLLAHGMVFSALNLIYAFFQDRITFPKTFSDYHIYRTRVPFLLPTGNSIRLARDSWPRKDSKEAQS